MAENNKKSTILSEHRRVASTRYILALINFIAILLGTVLTLIFVQRRGIYTPLLVHIYILLGINIAQIALSLTEFILRRFMGIHAKWLPIVAYSVGGVWIAVLISEMIFATSEIGSLRVDLLIVAGIQLVIALLTYLVWPMMDRKSIDAMTARDVREDEEKRGKKAKKFVTIYGLICGLVVLTQAATLFVYKMPPTFYDLFSDTRALQYEYNEDYEGYFVKAVYKGTSTTVNIPATYNNLPVVGIAEGALVDENISEQYKFNSITFGTEETDAEGNTRMVSNLRYIASGAIHNNKIDAITIPASVEKIETGAVVSTSIKTINYSAKSAFSYGGFSCSALKQVVMSGEEVGQIESLEGMAATVEIKVDKDIYNDYRAANIAYVSSFTPILGADEFCIDFFTDCDYYIDSIFKKVGESTTLKYSELQKAGQEGNSLAVDTKAYIENPHEVNTNGAKPNSAFRGWYTDPAYTEEFNFTLTGSDAITKNIKLYAKWIDEYTGTLNWGTHVPEQSELPNGAEVLTEMHWTDEDKATFPVVTNRLGYTNGVVWKINGGEAVKDSLGISESVRLDAEWQLDAPIVSIAKTLPETGASINGNQISFMYDPMRRLELLAEYNHVLPSTDENFTRTWVKVIEKEGQTDLNYDLQGERSLEIKNFIEGGKYTLTVVYQAKDALGRATETASASAEIIVNITKKPLEHTEVFKLENKNTVYNGQQQTVDLTGSILSDNVLPSYSYYDANGVELSTKSAKNVGEYNVVAIFQKNNAEEAPNYETKKLEAKLTIDPAPISVTGWKAVDGDGEKVYKAAPYTVEAELSGLVDGDTAGLVYEGNVQTDAGNYTASVTSWNNTNYALDLSAGISLNWTIAQKPLTVATWNKIGTNWATESYSALYDGTNRSLTANPVGVCAGDDVEFTYENVGDRVNKAYMANASYVACVNGTTNPNYTVATDTYSQAWSITKRPLEITFANPSLTYNGNKQDLVATVSNFVETDAALLSGAEIFDYTNPQDLAIKVQTSEALASLVSVSVAFQAMNAGNYTMAINSLANETLNTNYLIDSPKNGAFTIAKKSLTIEAGEHATREYSGSEQTVSLSVKGIMATDLEGFAVEQFTTTGIAGVGSVSGSDYLLSFRYTDAGSYNIEVSAFDGNENYELSAATKQLTITRKPLTIAEWQVKDKSKTALVFAPMTENTLQYNYAGYEIGYKLDGVVGGDTVLLNLTNNDEKDVNSYTTNATLDTTTYKNYSFVGAEKVWSITPRELTVSWSGATDLVYTGNAHTVSAVISGEQGTDSATDFTLSGQTQTNAGDYVASVSLTGTLLGNYTIASGETLNWSIAKAPITLTWNAPSTLVYTGEYQGPSFVVNGLLNGDAAEFTFPTDSVGDYSISGVEDGVTYSFTGTNGFAVNAGTYNISKDILVSDNNYALMDAKASQFTIKQKPITLSGVWTAENNGADVTGLAHVYNGQSYTYTTTIKEGEIVSHLGNSAVVGIVYSNNAQVNAGENYTATATGLSGTYAANYVLKGDSVSFSIAKKGVDLHWNTTSFGYSVGEHTISADILTGGVSADDGKAYEAISVNSYTGNSATNAGIYEATALSLNNSNYSIKSNATTAWEITKKEVSSLNWSTNSFVYNAKVQYPTASFYYNGETVEASAYTGSTTSKTASANYEVTATKLDSENYVFSASGNFSKSYSITPRALTISWNNTSGLVYNGSAHTVTPVLDGVQGSDSVQYTLSGETQTNAGSYTATISLTGTLAANYEISYGSSCNYSIAKKGVSLVWSQSTFQYDGKAHSLTATIEGTIAGETLTPVYSGNGNSQTNAKSYTVTAGLPASTVAENYQITSGNTTQTLKIEPQVVNVVWGATTSFVYDGYSHSIQGTTVKGKSNGSTVNVLYTMSGNECINVGTSTVSISLNDSNYTISNADVSKTLTITPQKADVTWGATTSFVYDGTAHKITGITVTGTSAGNRVSVSHNVYGNERVDAGSNEVSISLSDSNYTIDNADAVKMLTVTKQTVTLKWSGENGAKYIYNGEAQGYTVQAYAGGVPKSDILTQTVFTYTNSSNSLYTATAEIANTNNYKFAVGTEVERSFQISRQEVSAVWSNITFTYDGYSHQPTVFIEDAQGNEVSYEFVINSAHICEATNAGTYTARIRPSDDNYRITVATSSCEWTIVPRTIALNWSSVPEAYTGSVLGQPTASISNVVSYDDVWFNYSLTKKGTSGEYVTESNIRWGEYKVSITSIGGNAASNYTLDGVVNTSITFVVEDMSPKTMLTATWSGSNTVSYTGVNYASSSNRPATVSFDQQLSRTPTYYVEAKEGDVWVRRSLAVEVGEYRIVVQLSSADAENYEIDQQYFEFSIV